MNDIRFRAWDWDSKRMIYTSVLDIILGKEGVDLHEEMEFMLSTNNYDRNGKEIYAGDILLDAYYDHYFGEWVVMKAVVVYDGSKPNFVLDWHTIKGGSVNDYYNDNTILFDKFVVVGNKFENPELCRFWS